MLFKKRKSLKTRIENLEKAVAELSKKTISQRTQEEDAPKSYSQIIDEWLNGKEEEVSGK